MILSKKIFNLNVNQTFVLFVRKKFFLIIHVNMLLQTENYYRVA